MASLQREPTGVFHIVFRISGKKYKRSLETKSEAIALVRRDEIDETIQLLKRGRLLLLQDVSVADFILTGGEASKKNTTLGSPVEIPKGITISELFREFGIPQ